MSLILTNIYRGHNDVARLQNRMLRSHNGMLTVLHDMNNNPIDSFPETPAAVQQLQG
jgi:hypothetical protein